MTDIRIEREFSVTPERLFSAITQSADLLAWWGPENMSVSEGQLNFTSTGPWFAVIYGSDGVRYKMAGQVTHVDPPRSVGLSWAWHDEEDQRGPESFVTLTVKQTTAGSQLVVDHRELGDGDIAASHEQGWTSSLASLATFLED